MNEKIKVAAVSMIGVGVLVAAYALGKRSGDADYEAGDFDENSDADDYADVEETE